MVVQQARLEQEQKQLLQNIGGKKVPPPGPPPKGPTKIAAIDE